MCEILPVELWLNIFKRMEPVDLFKKRKVCRDFKSIVDKNLNYFYHQYSKIFPYYFPLGESISVANFIHGNTMIFIERLAQYDCSPFFIKKMQHENFSMAQVRLVLHLYERFGIQFYAGVKMAHVNSTQLDNILDLKRNGFPVFFARQFGTDERLNDEKMTILKKLKTYDISDYFCGKVAFEFTSQQQDFLYGLLNNKEIYWVHAINIAKDAITL